MTIRLNARFLIGLVVVFTVLALGWTIGVSVARQFDEVSAAWVQAVGSIAAIVGAVWVSSREQDSERQRRANEVHELRVAAHDLITEVVLTLSVIGQTMSKSMAGQHKISPVTMDRLDVVEQMIAELPKERIGGALINILISSRLRVGQARRRCLEYNLAFPKLAAIREREFQICREQIELLLEKERQAEMLSAEILRDAAGTPT